MIVLFFLFCYFAIKEATEAPFVASFVEHATKEAMLKRAQQCFKIT
jgi:hypothetical protein